MTSRALIARIYCTLLANQKRVRKFNCIIINEIGPWYSSSKWQIVLVIFDSWCPFNRGQSSILWYGTEIPDVVSAACCVPLSVSCASLPSWNLDFPLWDGPALNHGSCNHHLLLNICFDECNYHDLLQARVIEGMVHLLLYSLERYSCLDPSTLR